jgi:hypothetical protein
MVVLMGIVILVASVFGLYWTGKRGFHRRNRAGVEEFSSYGSALATNALEGIIRIVSVIGSLVGIFMIIFSLRS